MDTRKILTVTLEFELGERKNGTMRLKAANDAAVHAAVSAAKSELLPGSIDKVRASMTWEYRWMDAISEVTAGIENEGDSDTWTDEEESPEQ